MKTTMDDNSVVYRHELVCDKQGELSCKMAAKLCCYACGGFVLVIQMKSGTQRQVCAYS